MIGNRRVLAVVPARGGSKGIPLKNLRMVGGVPLVGLVGMVLKDCPSIDRAVVSTDHPDIAQTARDHGIDAPFMRPGELAGDLVSDMPVLRHALMATEATEAIDGHRYDVVVMLQPTSPLRRPEHVERTLAQLVANELDAVWTVSETDSKAHPLKQLVIRDGALDYYDPQGASIVARQQLAPVYHRNGVAYAMKREWLLEPDSAILAPKTGAVIIDDDLVNIDVPLDLELADFLVQRRRGAPASPVDANPEPVD